MRVIPKNIYKVSQQPCLLGESPFWSKRFGFLYWVDIKGKKLFKWDKGKVYEFQLPEECGLAVPSNDGRILLALRSGLYFFSESNLRFEKLMNAPYDPNFERFNDGKCDLKGRLWVGTVADNKEFPRAKLYNFYKNSCNATYHFSERISGFFTSNGLAISPDSTVLYWADTHNHKIFSYKLDINTGLISDPSILMSFDQDKSCPDYWGRPDGATTDNHGNYWVAMYEGGRILKISASGQLLMEIILPVSCPTMPIFGGSDYRTLFITSAITQNKNNTNTIWDGHVIAINLSELTNDLSLHGNQEYEFNAN